MITLTLPLLLDNLYKKHQHFYTKFRGRRFLNTIGGKSESGGVSESEERESGESD